jgi:epoxyqueuosine reductase QueG
MGRARSTAKQLHQLLCTLVRESHLNVLPELNNLRIFDEPLMRVAAADDPLFSKLKDERVVGPHHLSPDEWVPAAKSVISYFLPFTDDVRRANRQRSDWPAAEWLYGRIEGERVNNRARQLLQEKLRKAGWNTVAPALDSRFEVVDLRSNWSERHIAFIAGLGTFNLSKSLITEEGCAGRFGSVVTELPLEAAVRPYEDPYEYCNDCGACIERCPVAAIDRQGKDHLPCAHFLREVISPKYSPRYGCGKCQTAVPCEDRIPDN